jgi:hypothetical protein
LVRLVKECNKYDLTSHVWHVWPMTYFWLANQWSRWFVHDATLQNFIDRHIVD